jgi:anti-sigma B factor antagonist
MSFAKSQIRVRDENGVSCVEFVERSIIDEAVIRQIGDELLGLVDGAEKPAVVIDFSGVQHLSSAALGVLINVHNRAKSRNGQVRLCGIPKNIFEVFRITKLDRIFHTCDTVAQALQGLA